MNYIGELAGRRMWSWANELPGGLLEEVVLFSVNQLRAELGHLVLHLPHLRVESLPDVREFAVDDAEVTHLDRNVAPVLHCN